MNTERAKQILASSDTIPVHVDGKSVWIERVDEKGGTATVHLQSNPSQQETVTIEQLQEGYS